ncbi:MAG: hypothetical protein ABIY70_23935, partial [Capsulimonas sp.]|uniref:hypothetical protein n=1 Tax=Capsulimonas sp. TaxID=2494211 RepID=UPI003264B9B2
MTRFCLILLFIAALLPWTSPVQAQQAATDPQPHLLIIIADHLTLADFHRPDCPNLLSATQYGQSALMSPGLAHGADPVSDVYATFGAGDTIRKGEILQGSLADTLRGAHISFTTIGDADGDDTGIFRPVDLFLPGAPHLTGGFTRDPLAPGGMRCDAPLLSDLSKSALLVNDLVVVHDGDFARLERENRAGILTPAAYAAHRRRALMRLDDFAGEVQEPSPSISNNFPVQVFFLVPCGPLDSNGQWDRLTPFIRLPGRGRVHLLTSDTTQTTGIVAARDIAPTILAEFSLPLPVTMTGASIHDDASWTILERLDRLTYLNQKIQLPFFWGLGVLGGGLVFFAVWFYLATRIEPRPLARRVLQFGVRMLAAWPLALLIAPLSVPPVLPVQTLAQYLAAIFLVTALIALLPSPGKIAIATAGVLIVDAACGTSLISQSALSAYYLSGIRFYGIGNESMG